MSIIEKEKKEEYLTNIQSTKQKSHYINITY